MVVIKIIVVIKRCVRLQANAHMYSKPDYLIFIYTLNVMEDQKLHNTY